MEQRQIIDYNADDEIDIVLSNEGLLSSLKRKILKERQRGKE